MDLPDHQRKLLALIRSSYEPRQNDDPYIQAVSRSRELELVQEISAWWVAFNLERFCVLTSSLLKRRDAFESEVESFHQGTRLSPFIEEQGRCFLEELGRRDDPLLGALARFELAYIEVRRGDRAEYVVEWEHEPYAVLHCIVQGAPLDEDEIRGRYHTTVSHRLPRLFRVTPVL